MMQAGYEELLITELLILYPSTTLALLTLGHRFTQIFFDYVKKFILNLCSSVPQTVSV